MKLPLLDCRQAVGHVTVLLMLARFPLLFVLFPQQRTRIP
jgi:hypothetical protein